MPARPTVRVSRRSPFLAVADPTLILTKAADLDGIQYATVPVEWKAGKDPGEVEGYAAVFGNVDLQGDLIVKGAFKRTLQNWAKAKSRIPLVDGHLAGDTDRLLGSVSEAKENTTGLWFRAVFSSAARAQDARTKAVEGHLSGVSIGWLPVPGGIDFSETAEGVVRVLKEIRLLEISLTPIPANPEAVLTSAKTAIGRHTTGTSTGTWDGPANKARLPEEAAPLRAAHAWRDPDGDPATKAAYKFIHHEVGGDGRVGAANLTGCSAGIAVLNGGRGGANIPDADRRGVYNHLAGHLRDGDREPPELKALPLDYETFEVELRAGLAISHAGARKAAVDALVAAYQNPEDDAAPGSTDGAPTADGPAHADPDGSAPKTADSAPGTPAATDQDPHAYALRFLKASGPPDGAPGGGPPPAPADPLTALDAGHAARRVDQLLAELTAGEEGGPQE
jgi:HK97 family phage prohead protease